MFNTDRLAAPTQSAGCAQAEERAAEPDAPPRASPLTAPKGGKAE